jgi:hypothetical protein
LPPDSNARMSAALQNITAPRGRGAGFAFTVRKKQE